MISLLIVVSCICVLIIFYQRFKFRRETQSKLKQMSGKLAEILELDSEEKVMVFTENEELAELSAQINALLIDRQKMKADFRRGEISSRKMLSNISHDIKTPLTVILGYLEILRLKDAENEMLEKTEQKAKQVLNLINEFFTLAKLEAGDTTVTLSKLNSNEICRESVLGFYEMLLQNEFSVEISIPEESIAVYGNSDAIQRILSNLISNAIRYGSDGKYLGVTLREDKSFAYIDIIDKGKGIEKVFADHIFERLYTMEDSRNREIQGNGLGLTIAKNLAVQMDGDILLCSEPYVQTTFTVKLKKWYLFSPSQNIDI